MKHCFMFGVCRNSKLLMPQLIAAVEKQYREKNIGCFVMGYQNAFDQAAYEAVYRFRTEHMYEIRIALLQPGSWFPMPELGLNDYEGVICPDWRERMPKKEAIRRSREFMLNRVDTAVCRAADHEEILAACRYAQEDIRRGMLEMQYLV